MINSKKEERKAWKRFQDVCTALADSGVSVLERHNLFVESTKESQDKVNKSNPKPMTDSDIIKKHLKNSAMSIFVNKAKNRYPLVIGKIRL